MHVYDKIIIKQGKTKPTKNTNFFGDFPSFGSIVQENVASSNPNCPQISRSGIIYKNNRISTFNRSHDN